MRTERDILGAVELPDGALYGVNTARALQNFDLKQRRVNPRLLYAMVQVKRTAAAAKLAAGLGADKRMRAVISACDRLLGAEDWSAFPTQALQGGAGTSTNMNVNEVLANLALQEMGHAPGEYQYLHPLDDVNRSQSTNDVYPTALRVAAIGLLRELSEQCAALQTALQEKENLWQDVEKLGRRDLMPSGPATLCAEYRAPPPAAGRDRWRLYKVEERLRQVNLGGMAVGTTSRETRNYRFKVVEELRRLTGYGLAAAEYPMDLTQNNDVFVEVSGLLKAMAVNLMKLGNDLRLMGSGPCGGLGELRLPPRQQGSSIMPGKVNPVIPEMVMQCAMRVIANDSAVTLAAAHGELELNAFLPLIADSLLESLELLRDAARILREKCIAELEPDCVGCARHLSHSAAFAASYVPALGYDLVAETVHTNTPEAARKILEAKRRETP
ncbi:MAG: aspartate ammonia-lyase [Oscillospiraceae bacterium]|nr:aspartate ammonia-lyase [Oscillospiraceae bacterium]